MPRYDCEICGGSGMVRLPIYRRASVFSVDIGPQIEESCRSFACPECADAIPIERLAVIEFHSLVDSHIDDPAFVDHAKRHAAHRLVDVMLRKSVISLKRGKEDASRFCYPMVATVGVVSPTDVAKLEELIAARQGEVAREVAEEAKRQIDNWGSHYGRADILKRDARRMVDDALKIVLRNRAPPRSPASPPPP